MSPRTSVKSLEPVGVRSPRHGTELHAHTDDGYRALWSPPSPPSGLQGDRPVPSSPRDSSLGRVSAKLVLRCCQASDWVWREKH